MLPVVALVGRPNVGKSTLFNKITKSHDAIVDDRPGVTRDRLYGRAKVGPTECLVVDSGGVTFDDQDFDPQIQFQVDQLIEEADEILFLVDAKDGLLAHDEMLAAKLRKSSLKVHLLVNKAEGQAGAISSAQFQKLGFESIWAISSKRGDGIHQMLQGVLGGYKIKLTEEEQVTPRIALVGRPNAGKSTLTNALVGEQRVIVSDVAGTTRDSVNISLQYEGEEFILTDTAGVRRRAKIDEAIEKFSVVKTLQAIERANVVVMLIDAHDGITSQDVSIVGMVLDMGRALVVLINKWDGLSHKEKNTIHNNMELKFPFLNNVEVLNVSALHGTAVGNILPMAKRAYDSAFKDLPTSLLNRQLTVAVERTPPPMKGGRKIRPKFAHQAGKNPQVLVIHGNQVESLPDSYLRYLKHYFAHANKLKGTPIHLVTRDSKNPFEQSEKQAAKPNMKINERKKLARGSLEKSRSKSKSKSKSKNNRK
ncbi:MAG: GTP-binding protein [Saprospiraceae bacterium]|jgi:GTP-binding protein